MADELELFINNPRIKKIREAMKKTKDKNERNKHIEGLVAAIIAKLEEVGSKGISGEVTVNNLDDVRASLRNELARANKPVAALIKDLNLSAKEQTRLMKEVQDRSLQAAKDGFEQVFIKKVKDKVTITNLQDIIFPENVKINNLNELEIYFTALADSLKDSLNITLPEPKVTVLPTPVNIPKTEVNVPEVDLNPLLKAINSNLQKLKSNSVTRPLAVRLSDGQKWIRKIASEIGQMKTTLAGFSDIIRLRGKSGTIINPATSENQLPPGSIVSGRKTVITGGTAVQLIATATPCRYVLVGSDSANIDLIAVGDSGVVAAADSQQGVIITGPRPEKIDIDDVSKLWVDSIEDGDSVCFAYVV